MRESEDPDGWYDENNVTLFLRDNEEPNEDYSPCEVGPGAHITFNKHTQEFHIATWHGTTKYDDAPDINGNMKISLSELFKRFNITEKEIFSALYKGQ